MKTLTDLYQNHTGKVSDKWALYLREYDRLFKPYRERPVSMLEIGVQNGGSLEIWSQFFVNGTKFVGCDINPDCAKLTYEDPRIAIIVGDATNPETQAKVQEQSAVFDLIVEDGSHTSSDIIKAFVRYFPALKSGGLFVAEDLHCSYWSDFEGGLHHRTSSIEFFKKLADVVNFEHWSSQANTNVLFNEFTDIDETFIRTFLSQVSSIEFINSMCIVRKNDPILNQLNHRVVAGNLELVTKGHLSLNMKKYSPEDQTAHQQTERKPEVHNSDVCVIIPYYNGSQFIERALTSIFFQTLLPREVIVINDGSTDEEAIFLHNLKEKYDIKVFDKSNGGQGSARNLGVKNSISKYISFLDQDDFYLENHISDLLESVPKNDRRFGFVYADLYEADGDGNIIRMGMIKSHSTHPKVHINNLLSQDMFILPSASLIDRNAFLSVEGFDPQFTGYEDDDLFLRIFRAGYSNIYLDKCVTVWCIHQASTSYSIKMSRSRFKYLLKLLSMFPDNPGASRYYFKDLIAPRFNSLIINDAITYKINNLPGQEETIDILGRYVDLVLKNPYFPVWRKIKLRTMRFALVRSNIFIFRLLKKARDIIR